MFRSLRNRNYRLYFVGSTISNTGTWLQRIAQDWLILQLGGGGTALGITMGLQFLPFLIITPFAGLLADRFPKRRVIQCAQTSMAATSGLLGILAVTGNAQVWHVYVLAFLFGIGSAIDGPARQSFVVEVVGKDDLTNAVGLNSASFNGARMLGPALAGLLIVVWGTGWVILLNAISYAAPILAIALMRSSEFSAAPEAERKPGMVREGLRYVRGRSDLMLVLVVVFFVGCFGLNFQITSALMATEVYGKGAGEFGLLSTVVAAGSLAGALVAARRKVPRQRMIITAAVAFGLLETTAALMPTYLTFAIVLPFMGFATLTMATSANAMMQTSVAENMRGRVMALYMMVFIGSTPLGAPLVGAIGEAFGARWSLIVGGVVSLIGTLLAVVLLSRRQGVVVRPHLLPRPHMHVWSVPEQRRSEPALVAADAADSGMERAVPEQRVDSEATADPGSEPVGAARVPVPARAEVDQNAVDRAEVVATRVAPRTPTARPPVTAWTSPARSVCTRQAPPFPASARRRGARSHIH